ncbi:MAG TPA: hypothetical protein ENN90_07415 [Mariniphaga anaerophila]|uniref:Uncharacterized protein n=1 Tax=Mariniphaga anaerophila TaxID=1484053 RepID=A0A831LMD2_9BACT|nr:hypothetical protein [Mariniphaga anaerophila]
MDYPANFNENIVFRNYLGNDYLMTGPLHNQIIDSVLYVYGGGGIPAYGELPNGWIFRFSATQTVNP